MITLPAIISGIRTLKDKSLRITLETQEITEPREIAEVFSYSQKPCNVALKEGKFSDNELINIPEIQTEFKNDKSEGQRLRNVLYIYWKKNKPTKEWDTYYKRQMEAFINKVKEELN